MRSVKATKRLALASAPAALLSLLAAACTSGVSQSDYDALKKQLAGAAPKTVVQAGQLQAAPAAAQPSDWDTAESIRGGLSVFATFDSSGPAAWDAAAHPLVYVTSEGQGYSHRASKTNKLAGLQIIDATTKKVVASALFDMKWQQMGTPHNAGVSPDGQWIYFPTTDGTASGNSGASGQARLMIVNAKTLKLHMILTYATRGFHHITAFKDWQGRDRTLVQMQQANGPKFILDPKENNQVVKAITVEDVGYPMGHPYSTVDPTGKFLYIGLSSTELRNAGGVAGVAKVDLEKGTTNLILGMHAGHPIGIVHTADGKFTYVADGHGSLVYKIDNATNKIVGSTSAGVAGPYGLTLNWDETELWTMGKGEGSHNTGGVVGIIDLKAFTPVRLPAYNQPVNIGGAIIDHGILHPDPKVNEIWVSSAGTWETIVVDAATKKVKTRIPSPNGGDTHSGSFVQYNPDFTGQVLADMGGPLGEMYAARKDMAAKAAAPR